MASTSKFHLWMIMHSGVKLSERVFFTENLQVMVRSGLSLSEALITLQKQTESKVFAEIIEMIRKDVDAGKLLSDGLAKFPKVFQPVFIQMVRLGELSGTLEGSLKELTLQMKKDANLRSKVRGAMAYPIVVLIAMLGITSGLMFFVVPKLLGIFKEFGDVKLPLPTRILIAISDAVQHHGIIVLLGMVTAVTGMMMISRTKRGKMFFHAMFLGLPIFGKIVKKVNLARFSRTACTLMKTDVPVTQVFTIVSDVLANVHYKAALLNVVENVKRGEGISTSLAQSPKLFPPLIVQMVSVGEKSGTVDELLGEVAEFYEAQVDDTLANLSTIIEPVLILVLGAMVGSIAVAVILPMYSLTEFVGS